MMLRIVRKGLLAKAKNLESQSKYRRAIAVYQHLINYKDSRYPLEFFEWHRFIGDCYYGLKQYPAALTYYSVAELGFAQLDRWEEVVNIDRDILKVKNMMSDD